MNKFINESKILSAPKINCFAKSLVANTLPLLQTRSANGSLRVTVTEMAIHVATILLCGQDKVLEPLRNLAFYPFKMAVRSLLFSLHIFRALSPWKTNLLTFELLNPSAHSGGENLACLPQTPKHCVSQASLEEQNQWHEYILKGELYLSDSCV